MVVRGYALAAIIGVLPPGCAKLTGTPPADTQTDPPPMVPTSLPTAPPTFQAPDPGGPLPNPSASPVPPETTKARAATLSGDYKTVRKLLSDKVKSGRASKEEAQMLLNACGQLKDKSCVSMVRKTVPDVDTP